MDSLQQTSNASHKLSTAHTDCILAMTPLFQKRLFQHFMMEATYSRIHHRRVGLTSYNDSSVASRAEKNGREMETRADKAKRASLN
jgi:hypothetical protein